MIRTLDASLRLPSLRCSNLQHLQDRENDIKKRPKTSATSFLDLRRYILKVGSTLYSLTLKVKAEVLSETQIPTYQNTRRNISQNMSLYIRQHKHSTNLWRFFYVIVFIFSINHRYLFRKCIGLLFRICLQLSLAANFALIDVHRIAL